MVYQWPVVDVPLNDKGGHSKVPFESTSTYPLKECTRNDHAPLHVDPTAYVEELLPQASPGLIAGRFGERLVIFSVRYIFHNANTAGAMV